MKLGDLSGVEAWSASAMPPPGKYTVRVDDAEEGKSKGGYDQLELSFTVVDGSFSGAEFRDWLVVTPAALGKVVALLQAVGLEMPAGEFDLDPKALIGRHCEAVLREEPKWDDATKMVTKVAGYRPASAQPTTNGAGSKSAPAGDDLPFVYRPVDFEERYHGWSHFG